MIGNVRDRKRDRGTDKTETDRQRQRNGGRVGRGRGPAWTGMFANITDGRRQAGERCAVTVSILVQESHSHTH